MRILVTGSRTWADWNAFNVALLDACAGGTNLVIVHGACPKGADAFADRWAKYQGIRVERYPADWSLHGKRAGFVRNAEMVGLGADLCLAFIRNGSAGASMTADLAERAGIPTRRFTKHYGDPE